MPTSMNQWENSVKYQAKFYEKDWTCLKIHTVEDKVYTVLQ